jgi:bifunctional UDP-N-acetylglucosamine pyrophosphorylase / glucosamine-1-phosphate N-acetyltransferase
MGDDSAIRRLLEKGVRMDAPGSIEISPDVDPDRISGDGVTLYGGCRLFGAKTLICRGVQLGREAPVTLDNCQVGPDVALKGGYVKEAVFLKGAAMGSGAHVREGTILEEGSSGAHTVGMKQTILFPHVTLGSLINFCDCLMAGGTGPKDHSEVGSSYIHFNFTPNQDKATASMMGDVPRGVLLNQPPIFLGGQGGLVGPTRLAFGTVVAAGSICRKDELRPGRLMVEGGGRGGNIPYVAGLYRSIKRIVQNNLLYIANLVALRAWYAVGRREFVSADFPEALLVGLMEKLDMGIDERIKRLGQFSGKLADSARLHRELAGDRISENLLVQKTQFHERWPEVSQLCQSLRLNTGNGREAQRVVAGLRKHVKATGPEYLHVIQQLSTDEAAGITCWLQGIVAHFVGAVSGLLPAFGPWGQ